MGVQSSKTNIGVGAVIDKTFTEFNDHECILRRIDCSFAIAMIGTTSDAFGAVRCSIAQIPKIETSSSARMQDPNYTIRSIACASQVEVTSGPSTYPHNHDDTRKYRVRH